MIGVSFDPVAFLERRFEAARKAESIDEYRVIVDELLECVKEFQKENVRLEEENKRLKDTKELEERMERKGTRIILDGVEYCGACWGDRNKLIPISTDGPSLAWKDKHGAVHTGPNRYKCAICEQTSPVR